MSSFGRYDRSNEAISLSGHCLYEMRGVGIIFQHLTQLPNSAPNAVVGIEKGTFAPNFGDDFVSGNNVARAIEQQDKYLQRDTLELQQMSAVTQSPGGKLKLITFPEPD